MGDWREENNSLICESNRRGMGCVYPVLAVFGFFVFAAPALLLIARFSEPGEAGELSSALLTGLISLFGLVFFLVGLTSRKMSFYSRLRIDRDQGVIELAREKDRVEYRLGLAQVAGIELFKVRKSRGGSNTGSILTYQIFFVKTDGAYFWLDTFYNAEKFQDTATRLAAYTGLPLQDHTGLSVDLDRQREYQDRFGDSSSYEPSRFLEIGAAGGPGGQDVPGPGPAMKGDRRPGTTLTLRENRTFLERVLMIAVFTLFLGVPAYIVLQIVETSQDGPGGLVFALIAVPFLIIFVAIVLLVILMNARKFEIRSRAAELQVEMKFAFSFMTRLLGKTLIIPREAIRAVRVNRLDEGHCWLSLALDPSFQLPAGGGMLFAIGAFAKPKATAPWDLKNVLSLWEVQGFVKPGKGAGINDLLRIESIVQKDMGLDDGGAGS